MFSLIDKGGMFMIPLMLTSVVALAIAVSRTWSLFLRYRIDRTRFTTALTGHIDRGDYSAALRECEARRPHPMAEVLAAAVRKANRSDRDVQRAMEAEVVKVAPRVTRWTNYLPMIANVATLLGLLGTIQGLILCFARIADASAAERQQALADGISVAMFTTFSGLTIAIPTLVAYTILHNREMRIVSQIDEAALQIFNAIVDRNRSVMDARSNSRSAQQEAGGSNPSRGTIIYG